MTNDKLATRRERRPRNIREDSAEMTTKENSEKKLEQKTLCMEVIKETHTRGGATN